VTLGKSGRYGVGTLILDNYAQCNVSNRFYIGYDLGATGTLVNINGQINLPVAGKSSYVGYSGYGAMTVLGGTTYMHSTPVVGVNSSGVGVLTVSGGVNTFGDLTAQLTIGNSGTGTAFADGGTNYAPGVTLGNNSGCYGEKTVSGGLWNLKSHSYIGKSGEGVLTVNGGLFKGIGAYCIGRYDGGKGDVTVSGGTMAGNSEIRLGGASGSEGKLTLTGDGILKAQFIGEQDPGASSELVCDGGTLQVILSSSGSFIRSLDHVYLTANGMMIDTLGCNTSIESALEDASGEAGSFTKLGSGSVTLAAARTATGPVSVLQGTLVSSNDLAVAASGTVSKIDGTVTLTSDKRLIMSSGAAIAGVGTVTRVTLQDNAVVARDKADSATTPLIISDGIANDRVTIALSGYTLNDLTTALPLISAPTKFIDLSKVTVTLDGESQAFLIVVYDEVDGKQVLSVKYSDGTLILLR
jgi:autotransporter-associated beta strand protein